MSGLKPVSRPRAGRAGRRFPRGNRGRAVLVALMLAATSAEADPAPARVVSMNLCTDQLAMLLAAPGQLVSVSDLASDPLSSSMVAEAAAYPANRGGAEQIFLMHPDLVLAGTYTSLASVSLLRDLGVPVVQLPPVTALDQIPGQIRTVGAAMGREAQAEALVAEFQQGLAALATDLPPRRAALYYPNGYTVGEGTLADDVLRHAGFDNVGARAGLTGGGTLPLERLVMAAPEMIVTSTKYPGASRSEDILDHPALAELRQAAGIATSDADWVCGTPHILRALARMRAAREALE
jgi:iron complex transport system substrate-binding protein